MSFLRTCVTFQSTAFNTTEEAEEFINPGNFGKDVAEWLMQELQSRGLSVDPEIGQEDFGWYFGFVCDKTEYTLLISYCPGDDDADEPGEWTGWVERNCGLLESLFGGRSRGIEPAAAEVIHEVLTHSAHIRNVRWYHSKDMSTHREDMSATLPPG